MTAPCTRAGLPITTTPAPTLSVTTLPGSTSAASPTSTKGQIVEPAPIWALRRSVGPREHSCVPLPGCGSFATFTLASTANDRALADDRRVGVRSGGTEDHVVVHDRSRADPDACAEALLAGERDARGQCALSCHRTTLIERALMLRRTAPPS